MGGFLLHDFLSIQNKAVPPLPECVDKALFRQMTKTDYLTSNPAKPYIMDCYVFSLVFVPVGSLQRQISVVSG